MATSGSRDKNPFRPGGILGQNEYYLLVDRDGTNKGRITIKQKTPSGNITGTSGDRTVGFIPLDNSFQPAVGVGGLGAGGPTPAELRYFSSAVGQRTVKDKGIETVVNSGVSQQEATQLIRPNSALPGGTGTPAAAANTEVETIQPENLNVNPEGVKADFESDFGSDDNLRYPVDLQVSEQDYIQFTQYRNEGRSISGSSDGGPAFGALGARNGTEAERKIQGTVTLPIQSGITDSNGVDWGGAKLDAKDSYLASLALGGIREPGGLGTRAGSLIARVLRDVKDAAKDKNFQSAIELYLAQEAVGVQGLLSRASGAILNPNLELLFNGPTLRSFNFTFRLSPRSEPEAANVRRIIRFFKEGMSVKTASAGVFLKSPNIFRIKYIAAGSDKHKSLPLIKDCALLGCDVDYTPDGTYMTFNDEAKTMTSYQLTLRFSELDPIYNTDYPGSKDEIGY